MIYIEEKDGTLYKYKVDIDHDKLSEILAKLEENNFGYSQVLGDTGWKEEDIDFNYVNFDCVLFKDSFRTKYVLRYNFKLYKLVSELLGSGSDEFNEMNVLGKLLRYNGEEDLVSLINEEIKRREESLRREKENLKNEMLEKGRKVSDSDYRNFFKEECKISELYNQRDVASKLLSPEGFLDKYAEVMGCISFEKVGEINKEEYLKDREIFALSKDQCLKIECGRYCKYEVTFDRQNMEEILKDMNKNTGFMNSKGYILKTNLEYILCGILNGNEFVSSLLKYDSEKEEINIFRRKYAKRLREIADNMGDDIDEIINQLMSAKTEFPYSNFNMRSTVEPQTYYDKILNELRFRLIDSESLEEVKKAEEFDKGVNVEVMKLSLSNKRNLL